MILKKPALGLDPRVGTGFRKRSCSTKRLEWGDDSKRSHRALAVEPQQVVHGETESADRWFGLQASMGPVPVVAMLPKGQLSGTLVRMLVGFGIGPFAQCGLHQAFDLSIGFGCVGLGAQVLDLEHS